MNSRKATVPGQRVTSLRDFGVGVASVVAPAYIAEVSQARAGRLGSMQQLAIVLGVLVAQLCDAWLAGTAGDAAQPLWAGLPAWRWMFLVAVVPALVYGVLVWGPPESPRYLVARSRRDEARRVLAEVLGVSDDAALTRKVDDIAHSLRTEYRTTLRDLRDGGGKLLPVV